jgi:hypothetical protein
MRPFYSQLGALQKFLGYFKISIDEENCFKINSVLYVVNFSIIQGTVRNRKNSHLLHLHLTVFRHTDKRDTSSGTLPNPRVSCTDPEGRI